jgi:hypothetical protein
MRFAFLALTVSRFKSGLEAIGGGPNDNMAITNHERVGKALELLTAGLTPSVERELKNI